MRTNVKNYTDKQLWDRVIKIGGKYPLKNRLCFIAVQSQEDGFNVFDDKIYGYIGKGRNEMPKFLFVTSCTTNAGSKGLFNFFRYNYNGVFVWKTNEWYEGHYRAGYHKGKMKAWRLEKPVKYYRDNNQNKKAEEIGMMYEGNKNTNIHTVSYNPFSNFIKKYINGWSLGCIVLNDTKKYYDIIRKYWKPKRLMDFAILKEW